MEDDWSIIGCEQHVLFQCPLVYGCTRTAFQKYGPGTSTNIAINHYEWANIIHQMASNPYQLLHGREVQVRLAYFAEVVATYDKAEGGIEWQQYNAISEVRDKTWMVEYKKNASAHQFGSWLAPMQAKKGLDVFMPPVPKARSGQRSGPSSSSKQWSK